MPLVSCPGSLAKPGTSRPTLITALPPSLPCPCPRGEAAIVVHLERLDPGPSTDAAVTVDALKAEVGSLHRLQILASQLEPQLVCPGERWGRDIQVQACPASFCKAKSENFRAGHFCCCREKAVMGDE